ncbi:hypothetical protein K469DRAFT_689495 [Zopfia rhizophila CBS 207.26]|uniref:FHA domain-containing protein n=1 Tax=Zopfia rhizophila CBS 207.26 TaxID=1314779 RepID=A0A6A6E100_9PEZI|nr:hypothetical protein K469DRAFT_689495 [Zopfia rhizophila CBS 207.26]
MLIIPLRREGVRLCTRRDLQPREQFAARSSAAPEASTASGSPEPGVNNSIGGQKDAPPAYLYEPELQLTFSHGPKGDTGFALGKGRNKCDIVLPNIEDSISGRHCYITFDKQNRFILQGESFNGTIVPTTGKGERGAANPYGSSADTECPGTLKNVVEFHKNLQISNRPLQA